MKERERRLGNLARKTNTGSLFRDSLALFTLPFLHLGACVFCCVYFAVSPRRPARPMCRINSAVFLTRHLSYFLIPPTVGLFVFVSPAQLLTFRHTRSVSQQSRSVSAEYLLWSPCMAEVVCLCVRPTHTPLFSSGVFVLRRDKNKKLGLRTCI